MFVFFATAAGAGVVAADFGQDFAVAMFVFVSAATGAGSIACHIAPCLWIAGVEAVGGDIFAGRRVKVGHIQGAQVRFFQFRQGLLGLDLDMGQQSHILLGK